MTTIVISDSKLYVDTKLVYANVRYSKYDTKVVKTDKYIVVSTGEHLSGSFKDKVCTYLEAFINQDVAKLDQLKGIQSTTDSQLYFIYNKKVYALAVGSELESFYMGDLGSVEETQLEAGGNYIEMQALLDAGLPVLSAYEQLSKLSSITGGHIEVYYLLTLEQLQ